MRMIQDPFPGTPKSSKSRGIPKYLDNLLIATFAPYWVNQRLQSQMLHRNECHGDEPCPVSPNNTQEYERHEDPR